MSLNQMPSEVKYWISRTGTSLCNAVSSTGIDSRSTAQDRGEDYINN
jgi:hypothetical protein